MRTQIRIILKNEALIIPKYRTNLTFFDEIKVIVFQWLFVRIELELVKRNRKPWKKKPKKTILKK